MDDGIELVADDDGLAVIGEPKAVERYLRGKGLWVDSNEFDLRRLWSMTERGDEVLQTASDMSAASGRWIKLTKESAAKVGEKGLMASKREGERHLIIGKPGQIGSWLQAEVGEGTLWTNPAVLSGLASLMSQSSSRQAMAEITTYLETINEKIDSVLRKVDDAVVKELVGMGESIDRAIALRDAGGKVDELVWSTVDQAHVAIGATQSYALDQIKALTEQLEGTKLSDVAKAAATAEPDVRRWLGVLAYSFERREAIDVLEIDRRMAESPASADDYCAGMLDFRLRNRAKIVERTEALLDRMNDAVTRANDSRLWHRTSSTVIIESSSDVAGEVRRFHELLDIEFDPPSWSIVPLGMLADLGSRSIQQARDNGPKAVGALASAAVAIAVVAKKSQDDGQEQERD